LGALANSMVSHTSVAVGTCHNVLELTPPRILRLDRKERLRHDQIRSSLDDLCGRNRRTEFGFRPIGIIITQDRRSNINNILLSRTRQKNSNAE